MAKRIKLCFTATILCFLMICQSSTARPFNGFYPDNLDSIVPELNLALAGDDIAISSDPAYPSEKKSQHDVLPPYEMDSGEIEIPAPKRLRGKYGPLLLNFLPKGVPMPPSGPSKRTNSINN